MSSDHLSNEVSVSGDLTKTGVKAAAKSRAVAAIDRLVGNIIDLPSAWVEGVSIKRRAKSDGERQIIDAVANFGIQRLGEDREFAERALEMYFKSIARQQENKEAVVMAAIEDLQAQSPSEVAEDGGPAILGDDFIHRFEHYAQDASTEELRRRWGRVLASEIRKPGTFSSRVLRITDELDSETALLFERLCQSRIEDGIVHALSGKLALDQIVRLVEGGLMLDPGTSVKSGHTHTLESETFSNDLIGYALWIGDWAVVIKRDAKFTHYSPNVRLSSTTMELVGYRLKDAGIALSTILRFNERDVAFRAWSIFKTFVDEDDMAIMRRVRGSGLVAIAPSSFSPAN
ncbi:DUF2806 domain-containing protein [Rhizobium leguminosarum]|uniref:DUF2806 domain-containing protein n=1 Tax=Rhizobium leguminosarum TaxID=384 RepID=UPI00102F4835|nr:DUF2806 domain-containing protein [Rhizobium leguminosarum]TBC71539.1 DUF2806 domain-containing protein [Rhizobium leguminosarum]